MTLSLTHALSLSLCLPWCRHIINISVMLSHSAGWFITYFCVSACSLIIPLHLSLCLSLSYLMCLHTPCLSPSPCPSVHLLASSYCLAVVYLTWFIIFVPVSTCPLLLPDLLQHPPLASIENVLSHLTCVSSILEWVCVFSCHPSLFLLHFLLSPRPICHSHSSISLCPSSSSVLLASFHWAVSHLSIRLPLSLSLSFSLAFSLFLTHSHHSFPPWPHFFSQFHHSVINPAGPSISEVWEILLTSFFNLIL